jgi:hypothetical protein
MAYAIHALRLYYLQVKPKIAAAQAYQNTLTT